MKEQKKIVTVHNGGKEYKVDLTKEVSGQVIATFIEDMAIGDRANFFSDDGQYDRDLRSQIVTAAVRRVADEW